MKLERGWFTRRVAEPWLAALRQNAPAPPRAPAEPSVALLIDGENCSPTIATAALTAAGKFGVVRVRRVYANWTAAGQRGWREPIASHDLQPIQCDRTATGKNAIDIALVVDAMDLLHTDEITCFCLVASDSDYTPLVQRLRTANRIVVGIGRATTCTALTSSCSVFVPIEPPAVPAELAPPARTTVVPTLAPAAIARPEQNGKNDGGVVHAATVLPRIPTPAPMAADDPRQLLLAAWAVVARTRGEVTLSNLVTELQQQYPQLQPQAYGHTKLAQLIRARTDLFTIQKDATNPACLRVIRFDKSPPHHRYRDGRALLEAAWQRAPKQNGWVFTGSLGQHVKEIDPAFEPKVYGYTRLSQLLQAYPDRFELRQRSKGQYDVRLIGVSGKT